MKISNEFFIEQIKSTQKLVEADAIPDETTIVYGVMIEDRLIMSVHGDFEKIVNICFDVLIDVFDTYPSSVIPAMIQLIEKFMASHNIEKANGDMS